MVLSNAYNYINVLDKAADASWLREATITNNLANVDTPGFKRKDIDWDGYHDYVLFFICISGYKRKDVQFETYLSNAVAGTDSLDETVANLDLNDLNATVYNEQPGLSYRSDGNNVDVSTENVELAKNQIKYYTLMNSISQEFSRMKSALKTS